MTELIRWGPSIFTHAEFLLILYYAERTLTFGKQADTTSKDQIIGGIFSRTKREWIRGRAGLKETAVKKANKSLAEKGFLIRRLAIPGEDRYRPDKGNEPTEYEINWNALKAEFARRRSAPQGHVVTKPLGHRMTKPLGRQPTNNRGESSSKENVNRGSASGARDGSQVRSQPDEPPSQEESTQKRVYDQAARGVVDGEGAGDDDEPALQFTSPKAELAFLIAQRGGFLSEHEWFRISEGLELRGIEPSEFVKFTRPHLLNPKTWNPLGMVKSKLRSYAAMRRPASTEEDLHPAEASAASEKCPICGEVKGKGAFIVGDRIVACVCATEEWRAKVEKQEEVRLRRTVSKRADC